MKIQDFSAKSGLFQDHYKLKHITAEVLCFKLMHIAERAISSPSNLYSVLNWAVISRRKIRIFQDHFDTLVLYAGPHLKAWNKNQDTWWKGRRRALISGENFGKRKAENPRAHWQPKSREARRPTQLRREIVRSQRSVGLGMSVRCFNLVFVFLFFAPFKLPV